MTLLVYLRSYSKFNAQHFIGTGPQQEAPPFNHRQKRDSSSFGSFSSIWRFSAEAEEVSLYEVTTFCDCFRSVYFSVHFVDDYKQALWKRKDENKVYKIKTLPKYFHWRKHMETKSRSDFLPSMQHFRFLWAARGRFVSSSKHEQHDNKKPRR